MATTLIPDFTKYPIREGTVAQLVELANDLLHSLQGDADKAGELDEERYYQGGADALYSLLVEVTFPQDESEARICIHGNAVWNGNECGVCEDYGYEWLVTE